MPAFQLCVTVPVFLLEVVFFLTSGLFVIFALMPVFFAGTEEIFAPSRFLFEIEDFFIFGIPEIGTVGFLMFGTLPKVSLLVLTMTEKSMKYSKFVLSKDIFHHSIF